METVLTDDDSIKFVLRGDRETLGGNADYALDFDEACEAAELHAIMQDLNFVTEICDELENRLLGQKTEEEDDEAPPDADIEDYVDRALWIAALITYARCFGGGVRHPLPISLFKRTPGMDYTDLHNYYYSMRDKHAAHSVNSLEAHDAVVSLEQKADGALQIRSLRMVHLTLVSSHHLEVQQLGSLADYARQFAQEAYENVRAQVLEKAKDLSQEELRRLRPYEFKGQTGFASRDDVEAMKNARRGRDRKRRRGK